jgi:hypothetical protein
MRAIRKADRANESAYELGKIDQETYRAEKEAIKTAEDAVVTAFNSAWVSTVLKQEAQPPFE